MNTPEIITWLRDQAKRVPEDVHKRGMTRAADALEKLEAQNAAMAAELKNAGGCGACKHCYSAWDEDPCDSCRRDPGFPAWEWNGRGEAST